MTLPFHVCCIWNKLDWFNVTRIPVSVIFKRSPLWTKTSIVVWLCPIITLCYCGQNPMGTLHTAHVSCTSYFSLWFAGEFTKSNYNSFVQKNSLSRTLRRLRSLTRGIMLSSFVMSSALRHPRLSGNTRRPRYSWKKTVRGVFSLQSLQSPSCFLSLLWTHFSSSLTHDSAFLKSSIL